MAQHQILCNVSVQIQTQLKSKHKSPDIMFMSGQLVQKARVPSFQTMLKLRAEKEQREKALEKKNKKKT